MESQQKTCAAKSPLYSCKIEGLTGTAEVFVLHLTSQLLKLSPDSPCAIANHLKLCFDGAQKFEELTKSKNFCARLLDKISLIILGKKIFGVRCTLNLVNTIFYLVIIKINNNKLKISIVLFPDEIKSALQKFHIKFNTILNGRKEKN